MIGIGNVNGYPLTMAFEATRLSGAGIDKSAIYIHWRLIGKKPCGVEMF